MLRVTLIAPLILIGWCLQASSQSPPASTARPAADGELKLVVALFRHGVRAPLPGFEPDKANIYAGQSWPSLDDWKVPPGKDWGDLTMRGTLLATALGSYYETWYLENGWPTGFEVYLWADTDQRTIDTAAALAQGFRKYGASKHSITVASLQKGPDPLFHPFNAKCGFPDPQQLQQTLARINQERQQPKYAASFGQLYGVLNCSGAPCVPLKSVVDTVSLCGSADQCDSPIKWSGELNGKKYGGQFPYASSASEAFLLEYANSMPPEQVGWTRVNAVKNLHPLLQLHEAYFDMTERDPYLATINGSNLVREILDQLNRKAGRVDPIDGKCPRGNKGSQFIGLVGHDTNLAAVGKLFKMTWRFTNENLPPGRKLPPDTLGLPDNDALPAGALVFELRQKAGGEYVVRVDYVAQSLLQMSGGPGGPPTSAFRFNVACQDGESDKPLYPCEMSLDKFKTVVANAIGPGNGFLSQCTGDGNQVCP